MIVVFGIVGWLGGVASAKDPLTYEDALSGAVSRNVALMSARASLDAAEGQLRASRGIFDPSYTLDSRWETRLRERGFFQGAAFASDSTDWTVLQSLGGQLATGTDYSVNVSLRRLLFSGGFQDTDLDNFNGDVNVSVTQELLRGIRFRYNVQNVSLAGNNLGLAELDLEKQQQEVLYQAAEAYWSWAYQHELHEIARDSVAVAEEALRVGQLQVQSGQLAPVEATRLAAALVQARKNAIDAGNLAEQAANAMLLAMAESPSQAVRPVTAPGDVPSVMDLEADKAVQVALTQNLDLLINRKSLDQAMLEVANARHGLLPTLSATATAGVRSLEEGALDAVTGLAGENNQPSYSVRGVFNVPLGNRAARGELSRLSAVLAQREQELRGQERQIAAQVEEQVRALQSARQQMDLADANVQLAEETLAAEEALASAGRTLQKDVLEARTEVDRTRAEAAKARTDYRLAQALLLKLQGQLTEQMP